MCSQIRQSRMRLSGRLRKTTSGRSATKVKENSEYLVKPLEGEDRAAFQCGDEAIDQYFHERASRDMREKLAAVFILVSRTNPETIVGFFTLSGQQVTRSEEHTSELQSPMYL